MKYSLDPGAFAPERAHAADAGMDLRTPEGGVIPAGGTLTVNTGVHVQIPEGYAGLLVAKSGLNVKHDILSTGLIDSGYTGAIVVKLYNHGKEDYVFQPGDKITQLVLIPVAAFELEQTGTLDETERGAGGFGSTGK